MLLCTATADSGFLVVSAATVCCLPSAAALVESAEAEAEAEPEAGAAALAVALFASALF